MSEAVTPAADFILDIVIALLGGMLVGLERERAQATGSPGEKPGSIPGLRSFGLLSAYGAVVSYMAGDSYPLLATGLAVLAALVLIHAYTRMVKYRILGITTYIVMLVSFFIGVLAGRGMRIEAASLSVLVTLVLALKYPAERLAQAIRYSEILAMLEVAAVALVAGPIIRAYAAATGLDIVYKVYAFFTIVLLLSFTSYAAARIWGTRGIAYAAALGSLVNSEATISSVTSLVGELEDSALRRRLLSRLVPLVISVLQARAAALMIIALYIFAGTIPAQAALAAAALMVAAIAIGSVTSQAEEVDAKQLAIASPLSWSSAAKSALAYLALTLAFRLLPQTGAGGIAALLLAAAGGLVNATATILSLATAMETAGTCLTVAGMTLSIATATLNKILYAETGRLTRDEYKMIVFWSLTLSTIPLAVSMLVYMAC